MDVIFSTQPRKFVKTLGLAALALFLLSVLAHLLKYNLKLDLKGFSDWFDLDRKSNIPTAFKLASLASITFFAVTIALVKRRLLDSYQTHWKALAFVCGFLFLDEVAGIHQTLTTLLNSFAGMGSSVQYTWVAVYLPSVIIFVVAYAGFFMDLPNKISIPLLTGILFGATGTIGFILIKATYARFYGQDNLGFALLGDLAGGFQFAGLVLFVYSLMVYSAEYVGRTGINLQEEPSRANLQLTIPG